ncbi:MAG: GIY-YIG nuclease family protein [Pseudolabrys sp.]
MKRFYVYILANRRYGVLYVGVTNSLANRMSQHRQKLSPGFTNAYGVTRLVYFEEFSSIIEARARERSLKRWRRAWKFDLVDQLTPEWRDLAHEITNWSSIYYGPGSAAHYFVLRCARDTHRANQFDEARLGSRRQVGGRTL